MYNVHVLVCIKGASKKDHYKNIFTQGSYLYTGSPLTAVFAFANRCHMSACFYLIASHIDVKQASYSALVEFLQDLKNIFFEYVSTQIYVSMPDKDF
jgi:hypothetical protein